VLHREAPVELALEPAQQRDGACLDPLAPRAPAALVHHRFHPVPPDGAPDAPQLAWRNRQNLRRLDPA